MSKRYGKYSEGQWRENLEKLEAIFGQKEASKKLGVSPSTFRNWKTGKTTPKKKKQVSKVNRVYGQNKEKLTEEDLQRTRRLTEARRKGREKQLRNNPRVEQTRVFASRNLDDRHQETLLARAPLWIASPNGEMGQFVGMGEIMEKRFGKPKRIQYVKIYGLYTNQYERMMDEGDGMRIVSNMQTELFVSNFPLLAGFNQEWDLERTLHYLQREFFRSGEEFEGKKKFLPVQFLGYEL